MSLRAPRNLVTQFDLSSQDSVLAYEINEEKAVTLGVLGRRLRLAIDALATFEDRPGAMAERDSLVDAAACALWEFVVHRDSCGFSGTDTVLDEYKVPREVRARMGAVVAASTRGDKKR